MDIGGTFTDRAVALASKRVSAKVLTTPRTPEARSTDAVASDVRSGFGSSEAAKAA